MKENIRKYIEKLNPKVFGLNRIKVNSISKLGRGESNLSFLVNISEKKVVVRINMVPDEPEKTVNEYNGLKFVEGLNVAPKTYLLEQDKKYLGADFLINEYLEGESCDHLKKQNDDFIRNVAKALAKINAQDISKIKHKLSTVKATYKDWIKYNNKFIKYFKGKRKDESIDVVFYELDSNLKKIVSKAKVKSKPKLSHGDLADGNVIVHDNEVKFIDWEDIGQIDPAWDIMGFFREFNLNDKQRGVFLDEYFKHIKDDTLKERLKIYNYIEIAIEFTWGVAHIYEILEGDMHSAFNVGVEEIKKEYLPYVKNRFMRCVKMGLVSNEYSKLFYRFFPKLK